MNLQKILSKSSKQACLSLELVIVYTFTRRSLAPRTSSRLGSLVGASTGVVKKLKLKRGFLER